MNQPNDTKTTSGAKASFCLLLMCISVVGCALGDETRRVFQLAHRTVESEPSFFRYVVNEKLTQREARKIAELAWAEVAASDPNVSASLDYQNGFTEGFADYLYKGGSGKPPAVPPRGYWNMPYRNKRGQEAIKQWYAGFQHGADECRSRGLRELVVIPTPESDAAKATAPSPGIPTEPWLAPDAVLIDGQPVGSVPLEKDAPVESRERVNSDVGDKDTSAAPKANGDKSGGAEVDSDADANANAKSATRANDRELPTPASDTNVPDINNGRRTLPPTAGGDASPFRDDGMLDVSPFAPESVPNRDTTPPSENGLQFEPEDDLSLPFDFSSNPSPRAHSAGSVASTALPRMTQPNPLRASLIAKKASPPVGRPRLQALSMHQTAVQVPPPFSKTAAEVSSPTTVKPAELSPTRVLNHTIVATTPTQVAPAVATTSTTRPLPTQPVMASASESSVPPANNHAAEDAGLLGVLRAALPDEFATPLIHPHSDPLNLDMPIEPAVNEFGDVFAVSLDDPPAPPITSLRANDMDPKTFTAEASGVTAAEFQITTDGRSEVQLLSHTDEHNHDVISGADQAVPWQVEPDRVRELPERVVADMKDAWQPAQTGASWQLHASPDSGLRFPDQPGMQPPVVHSAPSEIGFRKRVPDEFDAAASASDQHESKPERIPVVVGPPADVRPTNDVSELNWKNRP